MSTKCRRWKKNRVSYVPGVLLVMAAAFWTNNAEGAEIAPSGGCCLPDGGGCIVTSEKTCDNYCGTFLGAGSDCSGPVFCAVLESASPPPPPILGACCLPDGSCSDISECNCDGQGGVYKGDNTTCAGGACDPNNGACCLPNGSCILTDDCACGNQCGTFSGPGTICGICPIALGGACCFPDGTCSVVSQCECDAACGAYNGNGTDCSGPVICIDPLMGACCAPSGTCSVSSRCECDAECGTYNGDGSDCSGPVFCAIPNPGACCLPDDEGCSIVDTVCDCDDVCGTYQGNGSTCAACAVVVCPTPTLGCWEQLPNAEVTSVNMILLKTGKVMVQERGFTLNVNQLYQLFDPATNTFSPSPPAAATIPHNMYCSGFDQLGADGRVLFAGGLSGDDRSKASIYDPNTDTWSAEPDMDALRFYPTVITLSHRENLAIEGAPDGPLSNTPEIFELNPSPHWRQLTDAEYNNATYPFNLSLYPILHVLSTGKVMYTGSPFGVPAGGEVTRILDPVFETWTQPFAGLDPIGGNSGCMFELDQIMKLGPIDTYTLAATLPGAQWEQKASLTHSRFSLFVTLLPDGKTLAIGSVLTPELYDPVTDTWSVMADASEVRSGHSSMVLLPDARVLTAGSSFSAEVYSPAYYYNPDGTLADRPEITSVSGPPGPDVVQYGELFNVVTPDAGQIDAIRLIRLGASTHGWNMGQQSMKLAFTLTPIPGILEVTAPQHPFQAPPGYFMLFVVVNGVPSNAAIVKLQI